MEERYAWFSEWRKVWKGGMRGSKRGGRCGREVRVDSFNSSEKETYLLSHVVPLNDVRGERVEVGARSAEGVGVGRHGNDARSCAASEWSSGTSTSRVSWVAAKSFGCSDVFLEKRLYLVRTP